MVAKVKKCYQGALGASRSRWQLEKKLYKSYIQQPQKCKGFHIKTMLFLPTTTRLYTGRGTNHVCAHTRAHARTHTRTHAHTRAHTHTHMHTHTCTHTHTRTYTHYDTRTTHIYVTHTTHTSTWVPSEGLYLW